MGIVGRRERVLSADKRYVWHPYTPMQQYMAETNPLVIQRAQGSRLFDMDGRSYLDGNASWWTSPLGHNHPRLVNALREQTESLCHTSLAGVTHEPAALFAEALVEAAPPGLCRVFFSDNGSTAVEAALRMSAQYWAQNGAPERTRFITLVGAFHGDTLGASALSGVAEFASPLASRALECARLTSPAQDLGQALEELETELEHNGERTAAIVLEPLVQGAAGMRVYPAEFLRRARALADAYGPLLVFDEVFTGYGRTGSMWAAQRAGVEPDILCAAKGLSGGVLPLAATLATERVFAGFLGDSGRAFYHGHTFCGNPLGARVAREVLAVYRDEAVLQAALPKAERLQQAFARMSELPNVKDVRCSGMLGALDLCGGRGYLERSGWRVYHEALKRGAYVRPLGNVVYLTPALNISDADLDELLGIVHQAVAAVIG